MKILLVSNYQPPHMGGIEFAAGSLKRCWEAMGHTVTWLTTDLPRGARESTPDNVRVRAINVFENLFQVNSPVVCPLARRGIARLVTDHDVVNVHSFAPGLSSVALRWALRRHRPLVVTQHVGIIPLKFGLLNALQEQVYCRRARQCVAQGARVTFVGKAVRDWFLKHTGIPESEFTMTPAGIDQDLFPFVPDDERASLRRKWQTDQTGFQVLFVGRFYEKKGLPLVHDLAAGMPSIRFTLVGSGPIDPAAWRLPNVRVIGFVSTAELRELYGCHDLFIMPSFGEGWPAVVPQAMACGLPCLVSEETFAGYGRDADRFVVCKRNADAMRDALARAASGGYPLLRDRKATADYAAAVWNWKDTAKIYEQLFREVIAGTRAPTAP
ncbi:MAG: Alpha-monoglucosyldiacylglycerol synthase [Verrucomicrobia bacterium ADurb.Bin345]|nr:MAG: Alpha-monoglucosyldiacylglycerol synthase [Verrucomicrobia bacterium ADurb.Bin345]